MKAGRVLETCIYADDLEAAKAFYENVLGLKPFVEVPGRHVFFRSGDAVFLVFNPKSTADASDQDIPAHGAHGEGHVAFKMDRSELEDWRTHLQHHGVEIESDYTWPNGGRSLYFRDPANNSVELVTPDTWGVA